MSRLWPHNPPGAPALATRAPPGRSHPPDTINTIRTRYFDSGIIHTGSLRYRIQLRRRGHGVVDQRHVWLPPTPHVRTLQAQPWIPAGATIPPNFNPVHCPDAVLTDDR